MDELTNKFLLQIGRIEGKIDGFIQSVKTHHDRMNRIDEDVDGVRKDLKEIHKDIDIRLRALEVKMYTICIVAGFISVIASALISNIFK